MKVLGLVICYLLSTSFSEDKTAEYVGSLSEDLVKIEINGLDGPSQTAKADFKTCIKQASKFPNELTNCIYQHEKIAIKKNKEQNIQENSRNEDEKAQYALNIFCALSSGLGPCLKEGIAWIHCEDPSKNRIIRRLLMEYQLEKLNSQGYCSEEGRKLIFKLIKTKTFEFLCFKIQMLELLSCRSKFAENEASYYSPKEIENLQKVKRNESRDCSELQSLVKCVAAIETVTEGDCQGRTDISDFFTLGYNAVTKVYYPFVSNCNKDHKADKLKADGATQLQTSLVMMLLSIAIPWFLMLLI